MLVGCSGPEHLARLWANLRPVGRQAIRAESPTNKFTHNKKLMATEIKTLYHSKLVNQGPVVAHVKQGVTESTRKRGTFYVILNIEGRERYYNVENQACGEAFSEYVGQTVVVTAQGAREDAEILIEPTNETPAQPARTASPAPRVNPPKSVVATVKAAVTPYAELAANPIGQRPDGPVQNADVKPPYAKLSDEQKVIEAKRFLMRNCNAMGLAADAAFRCVTDFCARHGITEGFGEDMIAQEIAQNMCHTIHTTLFLSLAGTWRENQDMASNMTPKDLNPIISGIKARVALKKSSEAAAGRGQA